MWVNLALSEQLKSSKKSAAVLHTIIWVLIYREAQLPRHNTNSP